MHAQTKSEKAGRRVGQQLVALVVTGSLVSACGPVLPQAYSSAGYGYPMGQPYRPMWSGGYRVTPPPPAYPQPTQAVGNPPVSQQQASGSNIENDALFGGAGYLVGRQLGQSALDPVATTSAGVGEAEAAIARGGAAVTMDEAVATGLRAAPALVGRAAPVLVGAAEVGAAEIGVAEVGAVAAAEGAGEVAAVAAVGEFLVPAVLIGGTAYLAYRLWTDSKHDR